LSVGIAESTDTELISHNHNETRLFIKPYCGWCHQAMRWLDGRIFPLSFTRLVR
jgi:hypothetical protein